MEIDTDTASPSRSVSLPAGQTWVGDGTDNCRMAATESAAERLGPARQREDE